MTKWDCEERILNHTERISVCKKMGNEGWELVAVQGMVHYFKRPIEETQLLAEKEAIERAKRRNRDQAIPDSNVWGDTPKFKEWEERRSCSEHTSNFVLVDPPETLDLTVVIDNQTKILRIMSEAGWYIKDVAKDRKVDGAFVAYTFTKRREEKKLHGEISDRLADLDIPKGTLEP